MWLKLSDNVFYFGPGGVTVIKEIDLRDKPNTYIFRTELYSNNVKVGVVKETTDEIMSNLWREE